MKFLRLTIIAISFFLFMNLSAVHAHQILGPSKYSYKRHYPQIPATLEMSAQTSNYALSLSIFPKKPDVGDLIKFRMHIKGTKTDTPIAEVPDFGKPLASIFKVQFRRQKLIMESVEAKPELTEYILSYPIKEKGRYLINITLPPPRESVSEYRKAESPSFSFYFTVGDKGPNRFFLGSVAGILLLSFAAVGYTVKNGGIKHSKRRKWERVERHLLRQSRSAQNLTEHPAAAASHISHRGKWDVFGNNFIKNAVKKRYFQFLTQLPLLLLFLFIMFAGLYGSQVPHRNITSILTWTVWWTGLIFAILFLGKIWCLVCPWNAIAGWLKHLTFFKRKRVSLSLDLSWPKPLRNIYIATLLFIVLTWLELGYNVTLNPRITAYLGILILMLAVLSALIFDRKSFCRYACPIGRVSGLYAMFSPIELRRSDKKTCRQCRTKDCIMGNSDGYGCPTFEYLGRMELNTYCILCTECVKSCPHDNISFNIRPFAADLKKPIKPKLDEAYLAIVIFGLTFFHGFTMMPIWRRITLSLQNVTGFGYRGAFTVGMVLIIVIPTAIYYLFSCASKVSSPRGLVTSKGVFINYAYILIPIALFYHLAHNIGHFASEGGWFFPVISDPLGRGWNLLGTANWNLGTLFDGSIVRYLQIILIAIGSIYAIYIAHSAARRLFEDGTEAWKSEIPMLIFIAISFIASLWMLLAPMEARMVGKLGAL